MSTWAKYPSALSLDTTTCVGPQPDCSSSSSIHTRISKAYAYKFD